MKVASGSGQDKSGELLRQKCEIVLQVSLVFSAATAGTL